METVVKKIKSSELTRQQRRKLERDKKEKPLIEKYDFNLEGTTWRYDKYEKWAGEFITPENRKDVTFGKYQEFFDNEGFNLEDKPPTAEDIFRLAEKARTYVRIQQKAFKKYLQGKSFFSYKSEKRLPIMTEERVKYYEEQIELLKENHPEAFTPKDDISEEE